MTLINSKTGHAREKHKNFCIIKRPILVGQVWSALLPFISSYRCFALLPILSIECWHCWAWFGLSGEEATVWIKTSPRVEPPRFQSTSDFWSFSIKFFRPFRDFGFIFWRNISLLAQKLSTWIDSSSRSNFITLKYFSFHQVLLKVLVFVPGSLVTSCHNSRMVWRDNFTTL